MAQKRQPALPGVPDDRDAEVVAACEALVDARDKLTEAQALNDQASTAALEVMTRKNVRVFRVGNRTITRTEVAEKIKVQKLKVAGEDDGDDEP